MSKEFKGFKKTFLLVWVGGSLFLVLVMLGLVGRAVWISKKDYNHYQQVTTQQMQDFKDWQKNNGINK